MRSPGRDDAIYCEHFATSGAFKVFQITVPSGKTHCSPYKFKIAGLVPKKGRSGALLGINFRFFTSLWPSEGSRRPNTAAMTPIGQQNPLGPLKLLGLRKKQVKTPIFILPNKQQKF
jgi:hypothetical protein